MYITLCPRELYTYFAQLNWFEALEKTYICLCKEANEWMDVVEHATSSKAALNANAIPFVPDAVVNETMHISNGSKAIPSLLSAHTDSLVPDVNQPPNSSMSSRSEQWSANGPALQQRTAQPVIGTASDYMQVPTLQPAATAAWCADPNDNQSYATALNEALTAMQLPNTEIDRFGGDPIEYTNFMAAYNRP